MLARERMQARRVERARQRLDAEVRDQRMRVDIVGCPEHGAEAPRIAQPQHAVAQHEVEVIVFLRRCARREHAQASGHAQMQYQMAVAAIDQQIFAAPFHRAYRAPGKLAHSLRHRPAQPRLAYFDGRNNPAGKLRRKAAARHFNFG